MQITVYTQDLKAALTPCERVAKKAPKSRPAVSRLRLSAGKDLLTVAATSLTLWVDVVVPGALSCMGDETGTVTVDPAPLARFLKAARGATLTLSEPTGGGLVLLTTDKGESMELEAFDVDEYPIMPDAFTSHGLETSRVATVQAHELRTAIDRAFPAASKEVGRYNMAGILLEFRASTSATMVATDGRRCHVVDVLGDVTSDYDCTSEAVAILPRVFSQELARMLPKRDDSSLAKIGTRKGYVFAQVGTTTVHAHPEEGDYPKYRQVLPDAHKGHLEVGAKELVDRMALASAVYGKGTPPALLFTLEDGALTLVGKARGRRSAVAVEAEVGVWAADGSQGEAFCLNADFLKETLKASGEDLVEIQWQSWRSPMEVISDGFRGVIMPITIDPAAA